MVDFLVIFMFVSLNTIQKFIFDSDNFMSFNDPRIKRQKIFFRLCLYISVSCAPWRACEV